MSYSGVPTARSNSFSMRSRGFTLLEIAVVLAIISLLAALSLNALDSLRVQSLYSQNAGDILAVIRRTRNEAFARGEPTAFIVDTTGNRYWGVRAPGATAATFLDTFDPAAPGMVIDMATLSNGTVFGPTTGFGQALDAPFSGVPSYSGSTLPPDLDFCSFCRTSGTNANFGLVLFDPGGPVQFEPGLPTDGAAGQQFTITGPTATGNRIQTIAIIAASGLIQRFEP